MDRVAVCVRLCVMQISIRLLMPDKCVIDWMAVLQDESDGRDHLDRKYSAILIVFTLMSRASDA